MKIACIVLASGDSTRFKNSKSKLLYKVYGVPIVEYTLKNTTKFFSKDSLYITIPKKLKLLTQQIFLVITVFLKFEISFLVDLSLH